MPSPTSPAVRRSLLLSLVVAGLLGAQDPAPPPGGFPIQLDADRLVTYSDGYRTRLDVRYPLVAAPASGWPCAMVLHGGGGSRKRSFVRAIAERLAQQGYLTLAYDTGNNGVTTTLNPAGRRRDPRRMTDLAEIFDLAESLYPALLDSSRLAIMGKSGGAKHALLAAAYSGQPLLVPGNVTSMPAIAAIHSDIQVIDTPRDTLPQGALIKADWAVSAFENEGPNGPLTTMIRHADYAGLAASVAGDPTVDLLPLLQQCGVPMLVSYAYDDTKHFVNVNADALATLPPGHPRRYVQITGGHGSAGNDGAVQLRRDFTQRWFDRFLKGLANGVDAEPFAEIAVLPSSPGDYLDRTTAWRHRQSDVWPLPATRTFYLRAGGNLRAAPPAAPAVGPTLRHRVDSAYDMLGFMVDRARPSSVLRRIPLVSLPFDGPALPAPAELLGRSVVELDVVASTGDFQLSAAIYDVEPGGAARFVTSGTTAVRQGAAGTHRLRIELGDVGYVFEPGHRIRVALENLNLKRQPQNAHFFVAPDFADVDLTVTIDPAFAPRVELPLAEPRASLTPRLSVVPASGGLSLPLSVAGEALRSGESYVILLSASGTVPGTTWNGTPVPINRDVFTDIALASLGSPFFPGMVACSTGRALPRAACRCLRRWPGSSPGCGSSSRP